MSPEEATAVSESRFHQVVIYAPHVHKHTDPRLIEHAKYSHYLRSDNNNTIHTAFTTFITLFFNWTHSHSFAAGLFYHFFKILFVLRLWCKLPRHGAHNPTSLLPFDDRTVKQVDLYAFRISQNNKRDNGEYRWQQAKDTVTCHHVKLRWNIHWPQCKAHRNRTVTERSQRTGELCSEAVCETTSPPRTPQNSPCTSESVSRVDRVEHSHETLDRVLQTVQTKASKCRTI